MQENCAYYRGLSQYNWLTRARRMEDSQTVPYSGAEIGIRKPKDNREELSNRWGAMLYLTTDLTPKSAFQEIQLQNNSQATLGYFTILEDLLVFDATEPRIISDTQKMYGNIDAKTVREVVVAIIHKWFNIANNINDNQVYRMTNHVAKIIREKTSLDGIIYRSVYKENQWNIALINEDKVKWGYSSAIKQYSSKNYRVYARSFSEEYQKMVNKTVQFFNDESEHNYPEQMKSIFKHEFPIIC